MRWYLKALVQNAMAALPDPIAWPFYYGLQRRFGELRQPRFAMRYQAALDMAALLRSHHEGVNGKTVLEVGTGRTVDVPLALWLLGAERVITVDLTSLLRAELVQQSGEYLAAHWAHYRPLFAELVDDDHELDRRYAALQAEVERGIAGYSLARVLERLGIDYRAPADASALDLPADSIDVHTSFVVLQHIPPEPMEAILREARRVLAPDGAMVHIANTGDHFAHVDDRLSPLHFLRYSERQWHLIAGNQFMYQNRLRADSYYAIFRRVGLEVKHLTERIDERALADRRAGLPLHRDFRGHPPERDAVIRFSVLLTGSKSS